MPTETNDSFSSTFQVEVCLVKSSSYIAAMESSDELATR